MPKATRKTRHINPHIRASRAKTDGSEDTDTSTNEGLAAALAAAITKSPALRKSLREHIGPAETDDTDSTTTESDDSPEQSDVSSEESDADIAADIADHSESEGRRSKTASKKSGKGPRRGTPTKMMRIYLMVGILYLVVTDQTNGAIRIGTTDKDARLNLLEQKFSLQTYELALMRQEFNHLKAEQHILKEELKIGFADQEQSSGTLEKDIDSTHSREDSRETRDMYEMLLKAFKSEKTTRLELEREIELERAERIKLEEAIAEHNRTTKKLLQKYDELTAKTVLNEVEINDLKLEVGQLRFNIETNITDEFKQCQQMIVATEKSFGEENRNIRNNQDELTKKYSRVQAAVGILKRSNDKVRVSFSAWLSQIIADIGPWKTIIFDHVLTNQGSGYSGKSGEFLTPTEGVYAFFVHILGGQGKSMEICLQVNGVSKMWLYSHGPVYGRDSNMVVIRLTVGDTVKVVKNGHYGARPFYLHHVWSTFSGFLLH